MILEVDKKTIVNKLELHIKKSISLAEEHKSKLNSINVMITPDFKVIHQHSPTRPDGTFDYHLEDKFKVDFKKSGYDIKIPGAGVLTMGGMSSQKTRHFLNNLCSISDWPINYLEIGVWAGSTFISSGFMNEKNIENMVAIDNFSQFDEENSIKDQFTFNVTSTLELNQNNHERILYEKDCFDPELLEVLKSSNINRGNGYNVYFYDGPHSEEDTYKSLSVYDEVLNDIFIYIVDDWQEEDIQKGAKRAINELGYVVHYEVSLHGKGGNNSKQKVKDVPYYEHWRDEWWQGQYVAILEKPESRRNNK